jgi:CheY-like chemotaxis protein
VRRRGIRIRAGKARDPTFGSGVAWTGGAKEIAAQADLLSSGRWTGGPDSGPGDDRALTRDEPQRMRPTLLIADDDPVVCSMLSMALEQRFDIVAAVEDGERAVASAAATRPDAAVIDVEMPEGGGARAVRGIAQASPGTAIVVLSADESDAVVRDLVAAGAMAYVRKGLPAHELVQTLESSMRAHRGTSSSG